MSMLTQIALGMIPGVLILIVTTIFSRKNLAGRIVALTLFLAVAAGGLLFETSEQEDVAKESKEAATGSLNMVYAMLDAGAPDKARDMLDELIADNVYVEDFAVCGARIAATQSDYRAARALYAKATDALSDEDVKAEYTAVCDCLADAAIDRAALEGFSSYDAGVGDPLALVDKAETARAALGGIIADAVDRALEGKQKGFVEAAAIIAEADAQYEEFLHSYYFETERATQMLEEAVALAKEYPALNGESVFRLARTKLRLICGDYAAIAAGASDGDYAELLILSELYVNDHVSEKDFSQSFKYDDKDVLKTVYEQLKSVYENGLDNEETSVKRSVKTLLDSLKRKMSYPALVKMETVLDDFASDRTVDDRSKIYLQLSRLNYDQDNQINADSYLTEALNSIDGCKDTAYTDSACEIINAINNKDDASSLKNVSRHVSGLVDNSTTIELSEEARTKNPEAESDGDERVGYDTYVSDYVSRKRTSINIISVDTSEFEQVSFTIGVDGEVAYSAEQLKEMLTVTDCGVEITDFTVESASYTSINIVLVCDTSGSMDGSPITHLRDAARLFVNNASDKENVGLVTFTGSIDRVIPLNSTKEQLLSAIDGLYAYGGTNMFDAVVYANVMTIGAAHDHGGSPMNIVILLSDGQDGAYHSAEEIEERIAAPYRDSATVLYTIGLGDGVDADYLDSLSAPTGGEYLHVVDSQSLESFYEYLHSMALNRYVVRFTAKDTLRSSRVLKVQITDDDIANDTVRYSIDGSQEEVDTDTETVVYKNKLISGLDTRFLYRTGKEQTVCLNGKNFAETDNITVELIGKLKYELSYEYVSDTQLKLTVPKNVLTDTYDLRVTIGDAVGTLTRELSVADELERVKIGGYEFLSSLKTTDGDTTTLSGYVCMNDWLCFDGDITLTGNAATDAYVILRDEVGSHVKFDKENVKGLASELAEQNKTVYFEPFGEVRLYADTQHSATSDEYKVEAIFVPSLYLTDVMTLSSAGLSIYPFHIKLDTKEFSTKFPFQDKLLDSDKTDAFSFEYEFKVLVSAKSVGIDLEFDTTSETKNYRQLNLGSAPIYVAPGQAKVVINTFEDKYEVKLVARLAFIDGDGVGIQLKWGEGLKLTELTLLADFPINTNISGVPVSFSDFKLGIADIDTSKPVYAWTLKGSTDIGVAEVSSVLPGLEKYVGDVSVCTFDDTGVSLNLGECYFKFDSKFKLLGKIDMGGVTIEAGKFKYENLLLGMEDVSVSGLRVETARGIDWKADNCTVIFKGTGEIALTDKYIGVSVDGVCDVSVKWWIFKAGFDINGEGLVGVYKDNNGRTVFTVRARTTSDSANKKKGICINWTKGAEPDVNTKFY